MERRLAALGWRDKPGLRTALYQDRAPCLTQQGDCVAVIAQQVSEKEVMKT